MGESKRDLVRVHSAGGDFEDSNYSKSCARASDCPSASISPISSNPPELKPNDIERIEQARRTISRRMDFGTGAVKFMLDGVVESHTAAMLEPYSRRSRRSRGTLFWDPDEIQVKPSRNWINAGFRFFTHAIGDRGIRHGSRRLRKCSKQKITLRDHRPRIEHIEDHQRAGYSAFRKAGRHRQFPAAACLSERRYAEVWARNVGPERAQRARGVWTTSVENSGGTLRLRQRLAGRDLESLPGLQNAAHSPDHGRQSSWRLCSLRSGSASKTQSRHTLWARPLPGTAKKQKARWSREARRLHYR